VFLAALFFLCFLFAGVASLCRGGAGFGAGCFGFGLGAFVFGW
jgi:hypothetical protein